MKKIVVLVLFCWISNIWGQNKKATVTKINFVLNTSDHFLGYDSFGFFYTLTNNVFTKVAQNETLEYKNISLGKVTNVDLQNPLKIVLFYEDFNTVVILDNQLNESQKINFSETTIPVLATAIGIASQNQLWVYNSLNQQIGLFDYLNKEYKTISIPLTTPVLSYTSDFNTFDWLDSLNNWYSCDIFGKITNKGNFSGYDQIQVVNSNEILIQDNTHLMLYELRSGKKTEIEILEKTFKKCYYKDQILSIFTAEGITNYKIIIP